jgi:hypothetical protein
MDVEKTSYKKIHESFSLLQEVMIDPTRVGIWFEIVRKPGITANELMTVIDIKKTAMYYHLTLLEEKKIVRVIKKKKVKHFFVEINFFDLYEAGKELKEGYKREVDLFGLYVINSLVQREITRVSSMSEDDLSARKYPLPFMGMWFCSREKLAHVKEEFTAFFSKINEVDEGEGADTIAHTPLTYFWGIADFE